MSNTTQTGRFPRPLTGALHPAVVQVALMARPIFAAEHLVQAWDAIGHALKGEKEAENIAFARTRLEHAIAGAGRVKPRQVKAYRAEVESLTAALADYVL